LLRKIKGKVIGNIGRVNGIIKNPSSLKTRRFAGKESTVGWIGKILTLNRIDDDGI
jgi:hypothetical protein